MAATVESEQRGCALALGEAGGGAQAEAGAPAGPAQAPRDRRLGLHAVVQLDVVLQDVRRQPPGLLALAPLQPCAHGQQWSGISHPCQSDGRFTI